MRRLAAFLFTFGTVFGQSGQIAMWRPPVNEPRVSARTDCAALRALTSYEFTISAAELLPSAPGTPEHCLVSGQVLPAVKFQVALPTSWNRRLLMTGNGGYAGENLDGAGRVNVREEAIAGGFVFTHTNTGHDSEGEPLGAFANDSQKLLDYAFRAVHVTVVTAKKIAEAYYGAAPSRSYFLGCSTGGRQALIAAQRFPNDFDGIVAGAPVLDFVGTMMNYVHLQRALAAGPISEDKWKRVGQAIYAKCDGLDGVTDGVIADPRQCPFEPAADLPKCQNGNGKECFTQPELQALSAVFSEQRVGNQRVFPPWPMGAEALRPDGKAGWIPWISREASAGPPIQVVFSEAFFRYLAFSNKDPEATFRSVDLERAAPRLSPIRKILNATDTDLSAFRARGGKLLMWYGWADPALNANMGIEYYESVVRTMGSQTTDFFRFFLAPGVFHCGGGPGCDTAPYLASLIEWVERGNAPSTITAARIEGGKTVRTRPLCLYPALAHYNGSGNPDDAASFRCVAP